MTLKTILFGAASALVLSAGAANAVPATAETSLHVRSGPGTQYEIVGTIPDGGTVDVRGCTGSWCRVAFAGGTGFASRSYLAVAGGPAPSVGVAVVPGYAYDDGPYYDDYDYGYAYGPSVGFAFGGRDRFHHRGNRGWDRGRVGTWSGGNHWNGHSGGNGNRVGGIQGRGGIQGGGARQGFAGPPASWQRPGTGIGAAGAGRGGMAGASVGMRSGGGAIGGGGHAGGGGGHAGGGGAQSGFAGSIVRH
jgi:hypothetical protein